MIYAVGMATRMDQESSSQAGKMHRPEQLETRRRLSSHIHYQTAVHVPSKAGAGKGLNGAQQERKQ